MATSLETHKKPEDFTTLAACSAKFKVDDGSVIQHKEIDKKSENCTKSAVSSTNVDKLAISKPVSQDEQQKKLEGEVKTNGKKPEDCTRSAANSTNVDNSANPKPVSQDEQQKKSEGEVKRNDKKPEDCTRSAASSTNVDKYANPKPVSQDKQHKSEGEVKRNDKKPEDCTRSAASSTNVNEPANPKPTVSQDKQHKSEGEVKRNDKKPEDCTRSAASSTNVDKSANPKPAVSQDKQHKKSKGEVKRNYKKREDCTRSAASSTNVDESAIPKPVSQDEQQKTFEGEVKTNDKEPEDCTKSAANSMNVDRSPTPTSKDTDHEQHKLSEMKEMKVKDKTADCILPAMTTSNSVLEPVSKETNSCDHLRKETITMEKLPSVLRNIPNLEQHYGEAKSIRTLLLGKTGSGKSTLTNSVLGVNIESKEFAKEGCDPKECTKKVRRHMIIQNGIEVVVWDGPGSQFSDANKQDVQERDLTLYCVRLSDIRFVRGDNNPDIKLMRNLTQAFGVEFWRHTVIVLTFANTLEVFNIRWQYLSEDDKAKAFQAKIEQWKKQIRMVLYEDVSVPKEIVESIQMAPAGHYSEPHLPGNKYWLSNLWFCCVKAVSTPLAKAALIKINTERIKQEDDSTSDDLMKPSELLLSYY